MSASAAPRASQLTRREREVLTAIWETGNARLAARKLRISWHTARTHTQSARSKLGVATTLEAIKKVV